MKNPPCLGDLGLGDLGLVDLGLGDLGVWFGDKDYLSSASESRMEVSAWMFFMR